MKHRLIEFLVKELGFTILAIEGSYAGCQHINNYILNGIGTAREALPKQGFWIWDTEEVISMIEWMKKYNDTQTFDKKIKFYGIDIQHNSKGGGIDFIENYLTKVNIKYAEEKKTLFEALRKNEKERERTSFMDSCRKEFDYLVMDILKKRGDYSNLTSTTEFDKCIDYCKVIAQYLECYNKPLEKDWWSKPEMRDYYIASNFRELEKKQPVGTKYIVWAHDGHIQKDKTVSINGAFNSLGSYLNEWYKDKYFVFGFSFNKGGIRVEDFNNVNKWQHVVTYTIKTDAIEGLLDWYFAQTKIDRFIINLKKEERPNFISDFIEKPIKKRFWGSGYSNEYIEYYYKTYTISKSFDALIFLNEVKESVPTETGKR